MSCSATPGSAPRPTPVVLGRGDRGALRLTVDVTLARTLRGGIRFGRQQAVPHPGSPSTGVRVGGWAAGHHRHLNYTAIRERPEIMGQFVGLPEGHC